ncbi:MAG TPA: hypothetical protein PKD24_04615 [Pyrinomonadaceae bacterium]|nr:hypothetical protein [Pyrinomonadaceae bacterium]HMP64835.1 hypothetical protein [Pyrinomonadaceae bacterium]
MTKLRGYIPTMTMMAVMLLGTTFATASVNRTETRTPQPCVETTKEKVNWGVIIAGLMGRVNWGVIIAGMTSDKTTVNCGVIIAGKEGG